MNYMIVGASGSGKTTLAGQLAEELNLQHIPLDELFWDANWVPAEPEVFRQRVKDALETVDGAWVSCGNHRVVRDLVWRNGHVVVWLDYPLYICLWRGLKRAVGDIIYGRLRCNHNAESWRRVFFSRRSILLWILKSHRLRKKMFLEAMQDHEWQHLQFVRLRSLREADRWLESVI